MKQIITGFLLLFLLSSCSPTSVLGSPPESEEEPTTQGFVVPDGVKDHGPAPELNNPVWLNTETPLKLADLRGKVVLLDMWTFGCYNCQNVIPYIREWYDRYGDQGLVVIGNHYPEFEYERDLTNLITAMQSMEIEYPVAVDNDGQTWRAYNNRYWPTLYLIDKQGHIRFVHIGEGAYAETEGVIQYLLSENYQ